MSTQKLDFSGLSPETLQVFFVAEGADYPKELVLEAIEEKERKALDEFEIRRRQFFQP